MEARAASTGYTPGMTDRRLAPAPDGARRQGGLDGLSSRYRRTSLYVRVVAINAVIVAGATLVLVLTPATVGYPISPTEAIVLVVGVVLVVVANALVLRISFRGLSRTVARMETVDLLQPQERLPVVGGAETRAVVVALNQMLTRLEAERRESSQRTLAALEGERRRIGQELHDEIGQRLMGMLLQLGNLVPDAPRELGDRVSAIQEEARATLDEVGVLAWQLRPGILDDLGLVRALEALVESLDDQTPQIRIRSALPAALPPMAAEEELAVYRIVQEALTNAVRHAGARQVALTVAVDDEHLNVVVSDDGVGIAAGEVEDAGIRGMRERALAIGSTLAIDTVPGGGVRVALDLPLRADLV
jgi:two-component system sensor histidine kinase UhpB